VVAILPQLRKARDIIARYLRVKPKDLYTLSLAVDMGMPGPPI